MNSKELLWFAGGAIAAYFFMNYLPGFSAYAYAGPGRGGGYMPPYGGGYGGGGGWGGGTPGGTPQIPFGGGTPGTGAPGP